MAGYLSPQTHPLQTPKNIGYCTVVPQAYLCTYLPKLLKAPFAYFLVHVLFNISYKALRSVAPPRL